MLAFANAFPVPDPIGVRDCRADSTASDISFDGGNVIKGLAPEGR
jgi:hypothetical protein